MKDLTLLKSLTEDEYNQLLRQAVAVIEASRIQIAKQLNTVAMSSYWEIGKLLEEKKLDSKHGDSVVKRLSIDLKSRYPDMGLSPRNLWDMKKFYLRYNEGDTKLRQAVALLPWSHNLLLMTYNLSPVARTNCRRNLKDRKRIIQFHKLFVLLLPFMQNSHKWLFLFSKP